MRQEPGVTRFPAWGNDLHTFSLDGGIRVARGRNIYAQLLEMRLVSTRAGLLNPGGLHHQQYPRNQDARVSVHLTSKPHTAAGTFAKLSRYRATPRRHVGGCDKADAMEFLKYHSRDD